MRFRRFVSGLVIALVSSAVVSAQSAAAIEPADDIENAATHITQQAVDKTFRQDQDEDKDGL